MGMLETFQSRKINPMYNIPINHAVLMDVIWNMGNQERVIQFLTPLSDKDKWFIYYLIQVNNLGGDDVTVEQQTIDLLDAIFKQQYNTYFKLRKYYEKDGNYSSY